jgi:hypothetical protein
MHYITKPITASGHTKPTMNKKFKEKFDSWDLKSFVLTIILLTVGLFAVYYLTDIRDRLRQRDEDNFRGQTKGSIISVEPIERMTQSKWNGTQISVDSYQILYSYSFQGKAYEKTDILPVSARNQKLIKRILERQPIDSFTVKFDLNNPAKSLLVESE